MHLVLFSKGRSHCDQQMRFAGPRDNGKVLGVTISVDASRQSLADARSSEESHAVATALHTLLGEHGLPATWGLTDPLVLSVVNQLSSVRRPFLSNEIALSLPRPSSQFYARRTDLADALERCIRQGEAWGVPITTLFADESLVSTNYDLLVKRGITAVCSPSEVTGSGRAAQPSPRQLRYGLWSFPIAHRLPGDGLVSRLESRLVSGGSAAVAARHAHAFHVCVELARLTAGDRSAWRVLQKSLRRLARVRTESGVRVECLRSLTARLSSVPAAEPQRSILRRAA